MLRAVAKLVVITDVRDTNLEMAMKHFDVISLPDINDQLMFDQIMKFCNEMAEKHINVTNLPDINDIEESDWLVFEEVINILILFLK